MVLYVEGIGNGHPRKIYTTVFQPGVNTCNIHTEIEDESTSSMAIYQLDSGAERGFWSHRHSVSRKHTEVYLKYKLVGQLVQASY